MSLSHTSFLILLSIVYAVPAPQYRRDVASLGPSGRLGIETRWGDTVGTATQVWRNGPARKNTVLHTSRTGPLSSVYRDALNSVREPCQATDEFKCEVAVNGFGSVGEVQFDFADGIKNIAGRSTQVMVACRCVDSECGKAVLIRPVNVFDNSNPVRKTCLYEAVGNGFTNCHTELLRSVRRRTNRRVEYIHGSDAFVYNVDKPNLEANWTAQGQRGWTRDCQVSEVDPFETITLSEIKNNIQRHEHYTPPNNNCEPPNEFVRYFQEADPAAGEECYATYEYASAAASTRASEQDGIATGNLEESYIHEKPELVSDTELALTCSAAGLGMIFVGDIFRKQLKRTDATKRYLGSVLAVQFLSFALEALPLHLALAQEISARHWISEFAFVDGSVAIASDQLDPQGTAEGSVLVLTAVLGTVQYFKTRVSLVAGLTVTFDLLFVIFILGTIGAKGCLMRQISKNKWAWGWTNHIVGFRSLGGRNLEQQNLQAQAAQAKALNAVKKGCNKKAEWQDDSLAALSTESLSPNASPSESTVLDVDIVDMPPDVLGLGLMLWGDNTVGAEGTAVDGIRRRVSPPSAERVSGDGSHTSRESQEEHMSENQNDGRHCRRWPG